MHWNKEVNRRCRKEGKCSLWSGGEVEVKTCSWAFVLCTGRPKKKSREQKAVISYKYSAFRGSQFLWLPKRKRGGLCVGGGFSSQTDDRRECACVCACLHQWVCLLPPGALYILHECVCVSLLRVIDNLESFSFLEWQIRGGSWLVVIQSHKRGHAAYGKNTRDKRRVLPWCMQFKNFSREITLT